MFSYRIEIAITDGLTIFDTSTDVDHDLTLIMADMFATDQMDDARTCDDDVGITT
jgi:hypothetical protein